MKNQKHRISGAGINISGVNAATARRRGIAAPASRHGEICGIGGDGEACRSAVAPGTIFARIGIARSRQRRRAAAAHQRENAASSAQSGNGGSASAAAAQAVMVSGGVGA